jgi:hypothetical protein
MCNETFGNIELRYRHGLRRGCQRQCEDKRDQPDHRFLQSTQQEQNLPGYSSAESAGTCLAAHRLTYIPETEKPYDIDQSTLTASNSANPVLNPFPG